MTARKSLGLSLLLILVLAFGALAFTGGSAGQASQCQPIEDRQLCVEELTVTTETLVTGEQGEFTATVANKGNASANAILMLHTASPENETNTYRVERISLEPDESQTVSRAINATTPGTHGLRLSLIEPSTKHVFDISAIKTVEVLAEHPKQLGGPIDRTEIALGALIASVIGILGLGYRKRGA